MTNPKPPRKPTPKAVETAILAKSARRCALCFHLNGDLDEKHGQIAHLDSDRANPSEDNLAFICLSHHSLFDSSTSVHKNYTPEEVKLARNKLHDLVASGGHLNPAVVVGARRAEADRRILREFLDRMPSDRAIRFLRQHDFRSSYRDTALDDIMGFEERAVGPEYEFLDAELEAQRQAFLTQCRHFLGKLVGSVYSVSPSLLGVPSEWEFEQPERYELAVKTLNDLADELVDSYDGFVRFARRKLNV